MRIALLLVLLLTADGISAANLLVHECAGAHGERVFSDRGNCAATALRTLSLPNPPPATLAAVAKPEKLTRSRGPLGTRGRRRAQVQEPQSYLCTSAKQSWYQHSPCSAGSSGKKDQRVQQTRVSRRHACKEIDRPASVLRGGSRRDQRAGPYDKVMGRDPCR